MPAKRRKNAPVRSRRPPPKPKPGSRRTPSVAYPLLSAGQVLRRIIAFSRAVTADLGDADLMQVLHSTLCELLPHRMVSVRTIEARTGATLKVLSVGGELRSAPDSDLVFEGAAAGFSVPLHVGGELTGLVYVNYRAPARGKASYPLRPDKSLVIPVANHLAVVAHTRRLLQHTAYLQDYLEQLIDQANVLVIATDRTGRVTIWNRAMARLTGYPKEQILGRDLRPWLREIGQPEVGQVIQELVAGAVDPLRREVRLPSAQGMVLRAEFNVVRVKGHDGEIAAVLAIGQDVTALRQAQTQVIHAEKLATVGQIAAGVAHEINNPLTSVQVCAEAVLRKATAAMEGRGPNAFDASDVDRLRKIQEGSERIKRFARELVTYARPARVEPLRLSINDVVEQGLSFCEHVLVEVKARVERDFVSDLPAINVVRDQLVSVVINLVTNAAHAIRDQGGTISVRTFRNDRKDVVGLAVSDDGAGIREADRPHIFDAFFTTKPPGEGTGLGLSVVRNIVYAHGGTINFQSRPGGGTTFMVTLPVSHALHAGTQGAKSA